MQNCIKLNFVVLLSFLFCLAFASDQSRLTPSSPLPVIDNLLESDNCTIFSGCKQCVAHTGCVWCLSAPQSPCKSKANCPFTGYTDCCVLLKSCDTCKASSGCGFCGDNTNCISGNATGPAGSTCNNWFYNRCPSSSKSPGFPVLLAVVLTIGIAVVILTIVLLFLFVRRMRRQNRARKTIFEYYKQRRAICDFCQDGLATVFCQQCKLSLCDHCSTLDDIHPPGVNHQLKPIQFSVQSEESAPLAVDSYTSFAGLLPNKTASSNSSFASYGSLH